MAVHLKRVTLFLAREVFDLEKCKLDGHPPGFGVPYRFYVGIKTEFLDFIEQKRAFDSLGEDLGVMKRVSQTGDSGRKTEFVKACNFMGIKRFLYIVPYILLPDLLRTVIRGMGRAALRPKA